MIQIQKRELISIPVWDSGRGLSLDWVMREFYEAMRKEQVCTQKIDVDVWLFRDEREAHEFLTDHMYHNARPHPMQGLITLHAGRNVIVEIRAMATRQEINFNYHGTED